jgi:NADPH:quinone reductase-like Zn-dependent oxidoreductase
MRHYRYDFSKPLPGLSTARVGLAYGEAPQPDPGRGEVVVAVRASSLNFVDLVTLSGAFAGAEGVVPLLDGAGEVVAVGPGVTRFRVGDRVVGNPNMLWLAGEPGPDGWGAVLGATMDGMLRDFAALPESALVHLPESLSYEDGASLPCAGLSAWNSLRGGPTGKTTAPGETVLVQGTGGVSLFALQFAKASGCRVIATTSTPEKMARMKALGADHVINYVEHPQWAKEVLELTGGRGVDLVVEVGGPNTLPQSVETLRVGGRLALIGIVAGMGSIDFTHLLPVNQKVLTIFANGMGSRRDLDMMLRFVEQQEIHPVIDRVFPFEGAVDAFLHFGHRKHVGKVLIAN